VGVVASIIPWNSPINNALWKIAPALAAGCTMVLKPAEEASLVALRIGELATEVGLPAGVLNVVTGPGETVGAALAAHRGVDKVAFTGSTAVGQEIVRAAAGNLKRVTLELGGKSPDIVFADADLDRAVLGAAMGVFANSGQACCAGTRIFVERPAYPDFVAAAVELAASLRVGNSLDPETRIGPVVSEAQLRRVTGYLDVGRAEGATTGVGGTRLETGELGARVLRGADHLHRCARRHAHRPGGDLRAGGLRAALRHRRRGGGPLERLGLRPGRRGLDP
jgi:aldehyde dehydrogenase (NAD+)